MRAKMKLIRDKRDRKLMKDVLAKWRQSYRSHLADQHYTGSLGLRYYGRWRKRLTNLDHLEDVADAFSRVAEDGVIERCWYHWKHQSQLQLAYKIVTDSIGLRVKTDVMDVWRRQMWAQICFICPECMLMRLAGETTMSLTLIAILS